jgi:peroxiredoxin
MKNSKSIQVFLAFVMAFVCLSFIDLKPKEKQIKNFKLKSIANKMVSLDEYRDAKGFVIVFTCNKCPMAKLYSDRLNKLHYMYKKQHVYLLVINSMDTLAYAEESFKLMQKKAIQERFNFPYLQDKKQTVAKQFGATHTPQAFIIWKNSDAKFTIKYQGAIDDNASEPKKANPLLINSLEELLRNKTVSNPITESFGCRIYFRGEKQKMN